jgi:hypothetical protein
VRSVRARSTKSPRDGPHRSLGERRENRLQVAAPRNSMRSACIHCGNGARGAQLDASFGTLAASCTRLAAAIPLHEKRGALACDDLIYCQRPWTSIHTYYCSCRGASRIAVVRRLSVTMNMRAPRRSSGPRLSLMAYQILDNLVPMFSPCRSPLIGRVAVTPPLRRSRVARRGGRGFRLSSLRLRNTVLRKLNNPISTPRLLRMCNAPTQANAMPLSSYQHQGVSCCAS